MKFVVDYSDFCGFKHVLYRKDEYSFNTNPWLNELDFDITLNTITLTVIDSKVVQLNGFCGLSNLQETQCAPPICQKGLLRVVDSEYYISKSGSSRINNIDMPLFINHKTDWLCIGYPNKEGIAVEFIDNCIFVIDKNQEFIALWIHPTFI